MADSLRVLHLDLWLENVFLVFGHVVAARREGWLDVRGLLEGAWSF